MTKLVVGCSGTLECLDIICGPDGAVCPASPSQTSYLPELPLADESGRPGAVDLSEATKLTDVVFRCETSSEWVVTTLGTVTSKHRDLQRISVHVSLITNYALGEDGVSIDRRGGFWYAVVGP